MRIIIYGAGGVGCVIGGHLALKGHDVLLIGRPGHVNEINRNGLSLVTPGGVHELKIPAVTHPDQIDFKQDDVVFLCMKGQDTEKALQELSALTDKIPVFCVQNGVRNEETASEYFEIVYGVMVRVGAIYLKDGEVMARRDPPGWLVMGRYPDGADELLEPVSSALRDAGFPVMITPDVMSYKWGKLMGNLANSIIAITNAGRKEIGELAGPVRGELNKLLIEAGIKCIPGKQLEEEWPVMKIPIRASLDVEAHSSSWQSLKRKQGTVETEFMNGEAVRLAKKLGKEAPLNEKLVQIMQEMAANGEEPGKYSIDELARELGI